MIKNNESMWGFGVVVYRGGKLEALNNESKGIIQGSNGVSLHGGSIDKLNNNGKILGTSSSGIYLGDISNESIKTLNNGKTGIIEGKNHGIMFYGHSGKIDTINNAGTIKGGYNGIHIEVANSGNGVGNITNSGLIVGNSNGIYNNNGSLSDITVKDGGSIYGGGDSGIASTGNRQIGNIFVEGKGSLIYGNWNGINLKTYSNKDISIKNGASILGKQGDGLHLHGGNQTNKISLDGENSLIGGGRNAIANYGEINQGISLNDNATIAALTFSEDGNSYTYNQEGTAILNEG
ncbi:hypothetical protein L8U00_06585, partial [Campylobacter sp. IFREMER_LSEM_CL2256]|uniref:hypothetical protein n=1 Tax=Campylobacter sp. IFREMER_LSEM_CL2256 TaxID=2911622 RepID=UPI0039956ADF|nr:hypothetical protein [Campylobacter sp. IFREMER_LSEM_CL2256]